uniref:GRF-type domain-containing protein n=1 Tax=Oryza meridionalis TaxID=40149 RepID=A0A0E0FDG3_9ORYZ
MATRSSGSSSSANKKRPNLPLIRCPCCGVKNIVELTATTDANRGRIFFTCPDHEKDGSGCNFWYWEEGYVKYLERKGYIAEKELTDMKQTPVRKKKLHEVNNEDGGEDELKKLVLPIVSIGLEIVQILKGMVVALVLVVVALLCLVLAVCLK